jgi:hypothetical protein
MTIRKAHLSGRHYTHRSLWHTVTFFRDRATSTDEGSYHNLMAAALFGFLALEAFVNDLGERIASPAWKAEQKTFGRGSNYPGTMGKLRYLAELTSVDLSAEDPNYLLIDELKERRHFLAHGRAEIMEGVFEFTDPQTIPRLEARLATFGDPVFVNAALDAVEATCDKLYLSAQKKFRERIVGYGSRALRGIIEEQSGNIAD